MGGADVTTSVTDTGAGAMPCVLEMVIVPLYVPAVSPVVLTETVRLPGVEPELGDTESQLPEVTAAVNATPEPPLTLSV